ncbi:MAG TPA: hypothetical protein VFA67_07375 [Candidatus Sulfotelmatobacter sp.]|nr:hypothetical protein [Candidatus Sulfotelmatobacter sp.]
MKRFLPVLMVVLGLIPCLAAADESFSRVKVPDANGKPVAAVLTFSDHTKAVEIRPSKGNGLIIPYSQIAKFSYEYTKRHRVGQGTLITAPLGIGALMMLTKGRSHWLEIDYDEQSLRKAYVLRMDKHDYLRILEAIKAHTGKDAEILGNANKR